MDLTHFRTGVGVDAHAFSTERDRPMWLAGLHWPGEIGIDAHSDGDVVAHAICDALFSACGLGDLGTNFGVDRSEYQGASGLHLMEVAFTRITEAGYQIANVAVQIIGNRPKLGARRVEAIGALSAALGGVDLSLTATTTDGLGFTGEGRGIAAIATALVAKGQ